MNNIQNIINDINNNVKFATRQLKGYLGKENISIDEFYRDRDGNLHYDHTRDAELELFNLIFNYLHTFSYLNDKGLKMTYGELRRNNNMLTIEKLEEFKQEAVLKIKRAIEFRKEVHPDLPIKAA